MATATAGYSFIDATLWNNLIDSSLQRNIAEAVENRILWNVIQSIRLNNYVLTQKSVVI